MKDTARNPNNIQTGTVEAHRLCGIETQTNLRISQAPYTPTSLSMQDKLKQKR
jgi:hypothetical protein